MELHREKIAAAGLKIVAVGIGETKHARRYCGKLAPSIDCFTNEDTAVYGTYGLKQASMGQLLNPGMLKAAMRARSRGHSQGKATGDVKMLPGTFIVDADGIIQYTYYSDHAGDDPDLEELAARSWT